jgi:hypothetical protein
MDFRSTFLALIVVQALHSIEEYFFRLYEVFPPARFISGLANPDLETGFLTVNISFVAIGACCYWWPVRKGWPIAVPIAWSWVAVETINGIGHPTWSVMQGGYTPGLATSLLLLPLALLLARSLVKIEPELEAMDPYTKESQL